MATQSRWRLPAPPAGRSVDGAVASRYGSQGSNETPPWT